MKVGLVSDTYYPEINGVATSTILLERELRRRGHDVYIFTTTNPNLTDAEKEAEEREGRVFRIASMPFVFLPERRVGFVYSPKAVRKVKEIGIDLFHSQTEFSIGIIGRRMARKLGIPVVHTYHTVYREYFHYISRGRMRGATDRITQYLSYNVCQKCDAVIVPSRKTLTILEDYEITKPIHVIPTGIDFGPFLREGHSEGGLGSLRDSLGIGPGDKVVLYVGRLAKEKSVDLIVEAFPAIKERVGNARLLLVGDGPLRKALEARVGELALEGEVIFAGERPWATIGAYYNLADMFISLSVTETQGLTFAEAMASGLPVIGRRDECVENIVTHGHNGFVVDDVGEIAGYAESILGGGPAGAELSRNARESVRGLSITGFGEKVESIYMDVLDGRRGQGE
ncbi:MAG: glycosyltransferase family 4 protein [Oscillospiraceae bacterium]|nr:glycosyltransferase family 4 protein [Oscillospiraceae bacterium]